MVLDIGANIGEFSLFAHAKGAQVVAIEPDRRRKGIASALLSELFARVDDSNARYTLEVRRSNVAGLALYECFGFRCAGTRQRYYQDNGEDAVIMWRTPATLKGSLEDVPNVRMPGR